MLVLAMEFSRETDGRKAPGDGGLLLRTLMQGEGITPSKRNRDSRAHQVHG
jgi:hypothetical protein